MTEPVGANIAERLLAGETVSAQEVPEVGQDRFGAEVLGIEWGTFSLEQVTAHVDVGERHQQPYGIVHGGVWCAIVESMASFGAALHAGAHGKLVVGVSNTTDFLRAHREGRVDAVASPVHVGRSQQLWQVVITRSSDGKAVARGQVRLQSVDAGQLPS